MLKRISILLLTILMAAPVMAQPEERCECMFAPKKGQFEIDLVMGQSQFFNDSYGLYYLLPKADGSAIGIGSNASAEMKGYEPISGMGNEYISADLSTYVLNLSSISENNLSNIIGLQGRYFVANRWDVNFMASYNMNMTPSKDFIEPEGSFDIDAMSSEAFKNPDISYTPAKVGVGDIYGSKAIQGAVTNSLYTQIGTNFYFPTRNERINPYIGVFGAFKMARIEAYYPYTGEMLLSDIYDSKIQDDLKYEEISVYRASQRAGQVLGFGAGLTAGFQYSVLPGLILGFEVQPVAMQYSLIHLQVAGQDPYFAKNYNLRAFALPQLKVGFRF